MNDPRTRKICMVGAPGVGKTSLVRRLVESVFQERYLSTIAVKVDKKVVSTSHGQVTLMLWDLAGDDDVEPLRTSYLRGSAGIILVVDGTRRSTLERAHLLLANIRSAIGAVPFVAAFNKVDLAADWEVPDAPKEWDCFRTSAKTGEEVEALFTSLAEKLATP